MGWRCVIHLHASYPPECHGKWQRHSLYKSRHLFFEVDLNGCAPVTPTNT